MTDTAGDAVQRRRPVRLPLLAIFVFVFGAAGLPGPKDRVEVVEPTATYVFNCILHQEGIAGPGVGVLTLVQEPATAH